MIGVCPVLSMTTNGVSCMFSQIRPGIRPHAGCTSPMFHTEGMCNKLDFNYLFCFNFEELPCILLSGVLAIIHFKGAVSEKKV
jgi:hypothetical protein